VLLALALVTAACSSDSKTNTNDTSGDSTTTTAAGSGVDYSKLTGSLKGSGSSFQDAFEQAAIDALSSKSDLQVTYNPVGSGQGKKDFGASLTDFGGTDSTVKPGDGPADGSFLYVPIAAAPITVSYNLTGVDTLQLSATTLAKIFQGDITKWDDAAIAADNPDAKLPSKAIIIVRRADGSGTTSNFTKYLDAAAKGTWKLGAGDTVEWPTSSQAGQKNPGVAQLVKDNAGAIGYVDLSDAEASGLTYASIKNKAGKFVAPTVAGAAAALEGAVVNDDLTINPLDAAGDAAYPITSPTYVLVRTSYADQAKADSVKGYVTFLITDAQDLAAELSFARISDALVTKGLAQLDKVKVG
jgi:phosphate transport system substrate-binding protein